MEGVNINFVKVRYLAMSVVDPVHVSHVGFCQWVTVSWFTV